MKFRQASFVLSCAGVAAVAGCGGGGSGGGASGGGTPPTPGFTVASRPLTSGDAFSYAGSSTTTDVFLGASPAPRSTSVASIVQHVVVSGPAAVPAGFEPGATAYDFATSETDTSPLQQIGVTTNTFYAQSGKDLLTYGYASNDTNGETLQVAYAVVGIGTGNGLVDILPEAAGQTWKNTNARTETEVSPGQFTATRRDGGGGVYVDNATYAATGLTSQSYTNDDGSGAYNFNLGVPSFSFSAPQTTAHGSVITVTETVGSATVATQTVATWYPTSAVIKPNTSGSATLYDETDVNHGTVAIPAACRTAANFGTQANELVKTYRSIDTVLGTIERFTERDYVVPTYGVACVSLSDVTDFYYDYSGQSANAPAFGSSILETQTISTTLGLTAGVTAGSTARRTTDDVSGATGLRLANARAVFLTSVERERRHRQVLAVRHMLAVLRRGTVR